jgi:hypothetical protein
MADKEWKPWWEKVADFDTFHEQEEFMRGIGGGKPRGSNSNISSALAGLVGGIVASNLGKKSAEYVVIQPQEIAATPQSQNQTPKFKAELYCVECGGEVKRSWKFCSSCSSPISVNTKKEKKATKPKGPFNALSSQLESLAAIQESLDEITSFTSKKRNQK